MPLIALGLLTPLAGGSTAGRIEGFFAISDDTIPLSDDPLNPTYLTGFTLMGVGFTLFDVATGAVRNDTGQVMDLAGTISFNPNKTSGGSALISLYAEVSTDSGASYTPVDGTLREFEYAATGLTSFESIVSFTDGLPAGAIGRFGVFVSPGAAISLQQSSDTVRGVPITGHSVVWALSQNHRG